MAEGTAMRREVDAMQTSESTQVVVNYNRWFLTHLDDQRITLETLPLELFYDYEGDVARVQKELARFSAGERETPLQATTGMLNRESGKFETVPVDVTDFNPRSKKFLTRCHATGDTKWRMRPQVVFEFETAEQVRATMQLANRLREDAKNYLRFERLFVKDLIHRYPYLVLEQVTRERIKARLLLDLATFPQDLLARRLMLQVEAQHVYAVLRATIASQKTDPFVQ